MKRAFRIMGLCALVAIAATACKKEAQTTSSFKATLTQPTSEAKTHLGSDSYLYWNTDDAIKVFDVQGNDYLFTTTENNVTTATFNGTDPIDVNGSYTAFYPAANVEKVSNDILLTLPATQDYAEGTFGNATYPMAALYNATTGFTFGSPCGLLAIPVKGTGNISSIELTSRTSGEVLAGQLHYNLSGEYQSLVGTETTVTLNCGNLNLSSTATTFYFVLPAGVFANGFTAVLKNGTTELYTLEAKQTGVNTIAAQSIKQMPEVEVQAIAVTTSAATGISKTAATLNGSYELPTTQGMNVTEVGFYFGTDASAMTATSVTLGNPFSLTKTGLTAGTTYYYKAYAKNGTREYQGTVESFTTLSDLTVSTGAAAATSATTATGHVTLTNAGSGTVTELGLCWGTSANPTVSNNHAVAAGQEVGTEYAINITGLTAGAQYYVRGYAKVGEEYYYAANSATFSTVWNGNLGMLSNNDPGGYATATDGMTIYGTLNANVKISIVDDGATVTLNNATITGTNSDSYLWAGINCENNATIILEGTNNVTSFWEDYPGIYIAPGKTLTIQGSGTLNASSNGGVDGWGAGIGGSDLVDCGNIVINSGTINATGGIWMAGIGGGFDMNCGSITINGGNVTATGGRGAAGIGTGASQVNITCGDISITGGIVNATGGRGAAGIGSGFVTYNGIHNTCGNISITGGQVTATGGDGGDHIYPEIFTNTSWANYTYYGGAGIGTGSTPNDGSSEGSSSCGTITIGSGVTSVTATKGGGTRPATNSIGKNESSSNHGTCGTINIGGTEYWDGSAYQNGGGAYLTTSPLVYPVPTPVEQIVDLSTITSAYTAVDGDILTGTLGTGVQISIADGATITLRSANINGSDNLSGTFHGLNCLGDATIILENNDNVVKANCGSENGRAGIYVPRYKTLTFEAGNSSGFVVATGSGEAAGIGGYSNNHCGVIVINSGKVTGTAGTGVDETFGDSYSAGIGSSAYKRCGGIIINGGQVIGTAYADGNAAGIGTGGNGICRKEGDTEGSQPAITISNTLSNYVKAQKGSSATYFIGGGPSSKCGIVIVGGTTYEDDGGNRGISSSTSLSYDFTVSGNSLIYMP